MRTKPWLGVVQRLHLWMALVFGLVFVVLGLTGSILVWFDELDHGFNPTLFDTGRELAAANAIAPDVIQAAVEKLSADRRYGRPQLIIIPATDAEVITAWYPAQASQDAGIFQQEWSRQVLLDPLTQQIKGERNWGEYGVSLPLLMPTIFHLHRYVLLGDVGRMLISISGLALILMTISGLYLWFPKASWKAWRQALTINFKASAAAIVFRLHRMLGFFALPVLLVLGFSGAYFNQPKWLAPVINSVFPITQAKQAEVLPHEPRFKQGNVDVAQALSIAQQQFPTARISRLGLPSSKDVRYEVRLRQSDEVHRGDGATRVSIDAKSGHLLRMSDPLQGQSGDRLLSWLFPLHTGMAFGLAGRIFICCFGGVPLLMMWSGWRMWRKRSRHQKTNPDK